MLAGGVSLPSFWACMSGDSARRNPHWSASLILCSCFLSIDYAKADDTWKVLPPWDLLVMGSEPIVGKSQEFSSPAGGGAINSHIGTLLCGCRLG